MSSLVAAAATAAAVVVLIVASLATCPSAAAAASGGAAAGSSFYDEFEAAWGDDPHPERRVGVIDDGGGGEKGGGSSTRLVTLTLNNVSGSGFQSRDVFLFGEFTMAMKLVPGDSAGTVTTFYLSSKDQTGEGDLHDEVDFEFLGNISGEPYVMQTNVFVQGKGQREQRFYLWFDPTADFHNYTILWNPLNIIFSVDGTPVRVFRNHESRGEPYLDGQAMKVHASLWNGEAWATMGGRAKIDWSHAPFVASYGTYEATACVPVGGGKHRHVDSASSCLRDAAAWMTRQLGPYGERALARVRESYMVMDYCDNPWRLFPPGGLPAECGMDRFI